MLFLLRHVETGRDAQPERRKLQRDVIASINQRIPDARFTTEVGRIFVETTHDLLCLLTEVHGILSFSVCEHCTFQTLEPRLLEFAEKRLETVSSFAVRVIHAHAPGISSQEFAAHLGRLIHARTPRLAVNLDAPEALIGVEIRGNDCYLFDAIIPGLDERDRKASHAGEPKFVADQMLGRLATWLRLLGFDTVQLPHAADSALLRKARQEDRILLTRDRPLSRARSVSVLLLEHQHVEKQLNELFERLALKFRKERMFSRCTQCNQMLEIRNKSSAYARVPARVYEEHDKFMYCASCDKLYWPGDHHAHILKTLERLFARAD